MKILIVDNNRMRSSWGARSLVREATRTPDNTVIVRRAPEGDLPAHPEQFDAVILSGSMTSCLDESPWVQKLDELIRAWIERGIPLLGVCYGHQSIARALGGVKQLKKSVEPEIGWTRVERLDATRDESPLFRGMPREFWSFSNRNEEVGSLPPSLRLIARSERCGIQAFQHETKPAFGVQFHPEKDLESCESTFRDSHAKRNGVTMSRRKDGAKLYDPSVAERIFGNFLELARGKASR